MADTLHNTSAVHSGLVLINKWNRRKCERVEEEEQKRCELSEDEEEEERK